MSAEVKQETKPVESAPTRGIAAVEKRIARDKRRAEKVEPEPEGQYQWVMCCRRCWRPGILFVGGLNPNDLGVIKVEHWISAYRKRVEQHWMNRQVWCQFCHAEDRKEALLMSWNDELEGWTVSPLHTRYYQELDLDSGSYKRHQVQEMQAQARKIAQQRELAMLQKLNAGAVSNG